MAIARSLLECWVSPGGRGKLLGIFGLRHLNTTIANKIYVELIETKRMCCTRVTVMARRPHLIVDLSINLLLMLKCGSRCNPLYVGVDHHMVMA